MIVASEMRSDGPWTTNLGCYGIDLESGRLRWASHGSGVWGRIVRMLDGVPGFTNEFRDAPSHIDNGKVYCYSGRVLDPTSGKRIQHVDAKEVHAHQPSLSIGARFARSGVERDHPRVKVTDHLFLRHTQESEGWQCGTFEIAAESKAGDTLWEFAIEQLGRRLGSYRLAPPFLYLLVSDEPHRKPHPTKRHYALPNPTRWHLATLSVASGEVIQDFPLGSDKHSECRIEDVDVDGLLIGKSNRELDYFRRTHVV